MGRTARHRQRRQAGPDSERACSQGTPCQTAEWLALRDWSKQHGLRKHKLTLAYFPKTFRGMMATRDIAIGEDIVEIPERLLMTASKVQHAGHLSEQQALTLWVCQQYSLGERSPWHAYISTLPQDFDSVPLFQLSGASPGKLAQTGLWHVLPRSVQAKIADQHQRLVEDWRCAKLVAADNLTDWRRFVWAWLAVSTRSINLGRKHKDRLALAPFLDFLNHSETAQVTVRFDEHRRVFAIRSLVAYRKGQEVFISYGPHDNRHMLVEYGFVLEHNPFRFLELDSQVMDWISECKLVVQRRKQSAVKPEDFDRMVEVLKGYGLFGDYTFDNEPSFRLLAALHLLLPLAEEGAAVRRVLARWERWRRGELELDERAAELWVEGACQSVQERAGRVMRDLQAEDSFLLVCLRVIWAEIGGVAAGN
ncbi:hypothetical protein EC988_002591 [Linderina pennispora]|nr:hypothetical protein EC988_002591 [Linderina pennispora]